MSRHASKVLKANANRPACSFPRQRCEEHEHAALLLQWSRSPSFKHKTKRFVEFSGDGARQSRLSINKADLRVMRLLGKWKLRRKTRNISEIYVELCAGMSSERTAAESFNMFHNMFHKGRKTEPARPRDQSRNEASKSSRAKINEISPWKGICRSTSRHNVTTSPRHHVGQMCEMSVFLQKLVLRNTSKHF